MAKHLKSELATTQARLDELPALAVVLDQFGHAWQHARSYGALGKEYPTGWWYRSFGDDTEVTSYELSQRGPLRLMTASKTELHRQRK